MKKPKIVKMFLDQPDGFSLVNILYCLILVVVVGFLGLLWCGAFCSVMNVGPEEGGLSWHMPLFLAWPVFVVLSVIGTLFIFDLGPFKPKDEKSHEEDQAQPS